MLESDLSVFVSYARADFPFAGWTAQSLKDYGLECWIDAEQLMPGSDWSAAIDLALDSSNAVLVLASAESLASPYCRREWQRAMAAGKPVVLAVIEAVNLPEELTGCPTVDMRAWSGPPWLELACALRTGKSAVQQSLGNLRVPRPVAIGALAPLLLCVFQIQALIFWVFDIREPFRSLNLGPKALLIGHLAILVGLIAWSARWAWRFLHRHVGGGGLGSLGLCLVPILWIVRAIFVQRLSDDWLGILIMLGMYGLNLLAMYRGVLVWMPLRSRRYASRANEALRIFPAADEPAPAPAQPQPGAGYGLYFAPQDERVAARFIAALERWGHRRASPGEPEAARFLLLSNATPADFAPLAAPVRHIPTICVLISAIAIPDDREILYRFQWADIRDSELGRFERFAAWLSDGTIEEHFRESRPPTAPILPADLGAVPMVFAAFGFLLTFELMLNILGRAAGMAGYDARPLGVDLSELGAALAGAAMAAAVRGRLITFLQYQAGFAVTFALLLAYLMIIGAEAGAILVPLVIGLFMEVSLFSKMRRWLPARTISWRHSHTLAPQPAWQFFWRQVLILVLAAMGAAVIVTSSDAVRH
jgi:hypothetical protein